MATGLVVAVVVLMALAFGAGFLIASRDAVSEERLSPPIEVGPQFDSLASERLGVLAAWLLSGLAACRAHLLVSVLLSTAAPARHFTFRMRWLLVSPM